ncbi:MAG: hypothetical protein ABSH06_05135 [Thermodesulfobacteriota bacterium]|jgi:hypothetical protein
MIAIPNSYVAQFFADMADFRPSADTIPPLMEAFRHRNLLPGTFHEMGPFMQAPQVRLRLSSSNNEWMIDFDTLRISIQKNSVKPKGTNMGTPEEFVRDATDFLGRILGLFPKKGNRLSLTTNGLMAEMPGERLQEIYTRVFVPLQFYEEHRPVGWNSRSLARVFQDVAGSQENLNIITIVSRIQGDLKEEGGSVSFDRIQVQFDINTHQSNREPRFDMAHVNAFYPIALRTRGLILSQLTEHLNG